MSTQEPVNRVWAMIEAAGWRVGGQCCGFNGIDVFGPEHIMLFPFSEEDYQAYKHASNGSEKEREMLEVVTFHKWSSAEEKAALGFIAEAVALADSIPDAPPAAPRERGRL